MAELSRKARMKLERQQKAVEEEAQMKADDVARGIIRSAGSPFTVVVQPQDVNDANRDISIKNVSVSVNRKALFKDAELKFSAGSRYGLMGANGRGKSTLLRLIAGGDLPVPKGLSTLLVEQEQECADLELGAIDAVLKSHKRMREYQMEVAGLQAKEGDEELTEAELDRINFLEDELQYLGASSAEPRAHKILFGLGFPADWHSRPVKSFSGGWRKRVALASAVFIEPDVLMLDEPTNHLDLNAVLWLDQYLVEKYSTKQKRKKCLIVVSHDAGFLDCICTCMVHIETFQLHYLQGGYDAFSKQLEKLHEAVDKRYQAFQKVIAEKKKKGMSNEKVDEWLREEVEAGRVSDDMLVRRRQYSVKFPFNFKDANGSFPQSASSICALDEVSFNYPGCPALFVDVSCALWPDSRITLCGPNGVGKSTLLNLLTGVVEPTQGAVTINRKARIGRYNQHFVDTLPLGKTCIECIRDLKRPGFDTEGAIRQLLGSFGLESPLHTQQINTLSGGQKARVAFSVLAAEAPHFLFLDEPTNHLDIESIEALCAAINAFKGGVLVVTHDSRLISETEMSLWMVDHQTVRPFDGGLEEYKSHIMGLAEAEEERRAKSASISKSSQPKRNIRQRP